MNYYKVIGRQYGKQKTELLKKYAKTVQRTAKMTSSRTFLIECRKHTIFPAFIEKSTKNIESLLGENSKYKSKLHKIIKKIREKLLSVLIKDKCYTTKRTKNELYTLQEEIINTLPDYITHDFLTKQKIFYRALSTKLKTTHDKKFNIINNRHISSLNLFTESNSFINLTNISVPDDVKWLLGLGSSFSVTGHGEFPLIDVIADTEEIVKTIRDTRTRDIARARIANVIANAQKSYGRRKNIVQRTITQIYSKCIKFCKMNKNVIVVQSDKGKLTVMMYASDYDKK